MSKYLCSNCGRLTRVRSLILVNGKEYCGLCKFNKLHKIMARDTTISYEKKLERLRTPKIISSNGTIYTSRTFAGRKVMIKLIDEEVKR